MGFVPDDFEIKEAAVPWFEDASSELGIKGHATSRTIDDLKTEIRAAMSALGGGVTAFLIGHWDGKPMRYGYEIRFKYGQRAGRIHIVALPLKKETPGKKERTLKQALYTVRESLQAQFNAGIMMPGNAPFVGYLLDDKGRTLAEALAEAEGIPLLSPPLDASDDNDQQKDEGEVVEGEFREDK